MSNILDNLLVELTGSHDPNIDNEIIPPPKAAPDGAQRTENVPEPSSDRKTDAPSQSPPSNGLQRELDGARQLIKSLYRQIEDLRNDRDSLRQQAEIAQKLLTEAKEANTSPPKRPWWRWPAG